MHHSQQFIDREDPDQSRPDNDTASMQELRHSAFLSHIKKQQCVPGLKIPVPDQGYNIVISALFGDTNPAPGNFSRFMYSKDGGFC